MNELAAEAFRRWKQADHPGWSVIEADSNTFLARLHQFKVRIPCHRSAMLCCAVMQAAMLCFFEQHTGSEADTPTGASVMPHAVELAS